MADKFIQVPANIEDPVILKRFITELVDKLNSNASIAYPILYPTGYLGNIPQYYTQELGDYTNTIIEASAKLDTLSGDAKNYITKDLQVQVLANSEDIATITTEFGTFYDNATAAAWYGLTVKTGELISGFTVGGVDTDTTTPGTAGSFFAISADTFSVGRAIEDINDPAELAYVQANNLPYGTMYNSTTSSIIPAFLIDWNGTSYDIFFNGKVSFTNMTDTGDLLMVNDPISSLTNNVGFTRFSTFYQSTQPIANITGDLWIDTDDNNKVYTWSGTAWVLAQDSNSALVAAQSKNVVFYQVSAPTATRVNDLWFDTDDNYKMYIWNGTAWVNATQDAAAAINTNTTTINGAKITTGSITASQIAADTITASQIAVGAITASEIATSTITADKIATDTITADKIATGAITASEIAASTITADKMSITSLSSISANIGTITAGTINADVVNAGVLNLAQIPQTIYLESDTANAYTNFAISNGGSIVVFGAYSGSSTAPYNFVSGKVVKVKFSFDLKVVTTSAPSSPQGMYVGSSAANTTDTPGFFIGTAASTTYHTISNEILWTPSSGTDIKCSVYLYNATGVTTTVTIVSGSCLWEQSWV